MGLFGKKKGEAAGNSAAQVVMVGGQDVTIASAVDCLGDSCPRPQLMTKKAVKNAASGDVVEIAVDNPTSMEALPPMCPALGATHLETIADSKGWKVYIRKDADNDAV